MLDLLRLLGECGCAVVVSAGNDGIARPQFPAAFAPWDGGGGPVADAAERVPVTSVGALNPNLDSVALFSNTGSWVTCYAPGAAVVSTMPPFQGGLEPSARTAAYGWRREAIDPDNYGRRRESAGGQGAGPSVGGFALWSGTSFAGPVQAGRIAQQLVDRLPADTPTAAVHEALVETVRAARDAALPPGAPPG
jgi:serine protease